MHKPKLIFLVFVTCFSRVNNKFISFIIPVVAMVLALTATTSQTLAATTTATARVVIQETLGLSEQTPVAFGAIPDRNGTCHMGHDGTLTGANGSTCEGSGSLGEFVVTGTEDQAISISVESADAVNGLAFTPTLQSESTQTLANGAATVKVSGALTIDNPSEGFNELNYILTVNYY